MMKPFELKGLMFLSDWFYIWVFPLVIQLLKTDLKSIQLLLSTSERSGPNGDALESAWNAEVSKPNPSVFKALYNVYGRNYILVGIWKLIWALFTWLGAYYFLQVSLQFLSQSVKWSELAGYMFSMSLLLSSLFSSIAIHQLYGQCSKIGIQVKSALTVLVYRKSLVLFRVKGGAGEVINVLSTDVSRITEAITNLHFLWSAFVEAILIMVLSFIVIGISALPALGIVLILLPVQFFLGKKTSDLQVENTKVTTLRVHLMSEVLTAIKLIKFYAWEQPFSKKINEIRRHEVNLIKQTMRLKAINFAVVFAVPVLAALLSLVTYRYTKFKPDPTTTFTILSIFNTLRYPFLMLPMAVKSYSGSKLSIVRLNEFLSRLEIQGYDLNRKEDHPELAISMENSTFSWEETDQHPAFLKDLSLKVKHGELVAVVGDVGSGKSSLIAAILGQMRQTSGEKLKVYGSVSYVPQEAWLLNMLLRDNITFGSEFKEKLYNQTIKVCALERDLTLLIAGDQTEIAERGSNLSGGQRQRVSLARAVYNDADIILLDDPLSAVDQNVGRHIFEQCIKEQLADKTIIFVTHALQYLPQVDRVIVMKDGKISKMGTYQELMDSDKDFEHLINSHVASGEESDEIEIEVSQPNEKSNTTDQNLILNQLSVQERNQLSIRVNNQDINEATVASLIERNQLSVIQGDDHHDFNRSVQRNQLTVHSKLEELAPQQPIKSPKSKEEDDAKKGALVSEDLSASKMGIRDVILYLSTGSGRLITTSIFLYFFLVHCVRLFSDFWLNFWIPDKMNIGNNDYGDKVYLGTYAALTFVFTFGVLTRGLAFAYEGAKKAHVLHDDMFHSVLRAPMSFFDTTPLGRILSAFSKHQFHIDDTMPDALMQSLQYAPLAIGALVLVAVVVHWSNAVATIVLVILGLGFVYVSAPAETKLKQLEAVSKPPIYAHLTASLEGLFSIRAYHAQSRFDSINLQLLDKNHESLYALQTMKTWTAFYLDVLSSFIVFFTSLFIVLFLDRSNPVAASSTAGLALSNALQMLVFLQWTVRMLGDVQAQMGSVGQLHYYGHEIPAEAPVEIEATKPPPSWPHEGVIEFKNIVLRYHKFGVNVLKNVNFTIRPSEKIGIVGRTGSGKSTLLISLLRIVEAAEGQILIDGVDISKIGLKDLRTKIAIIPQEPVLFVGSIRSNLDPFNSCSDEEIWRALNSVHLADKIKEMPNQLDSEVIENGKNFSLGQRQLFCIARAVLSKTKVLVLDEATAAIDMATDLLIQNAIKANFSEMTVLTIAHRLNTIIDSDKVLVMDGGKVMEFDEPIKLLNNPDGDFHSLVAQTGEATAGKLREIAQLAHEERKKLGKVSSEPDHPITDVFKDPKQ